MRLAGSAKKMRPLNTPNALKSVETESTMASGSVMMETTFQEMDAQLHVAKKQAGHVLIPLDQSLLALQFAEMES